MPRMSVFWFPVGLLVVIQLLLVMKGGSPVLNGELWTTDGYMRLVRVNELYQTADWYDNVIHRGNAPYGEVLHWTRPFDIIVLAGALALAPALGFDTALYWSGVLVSPLLHVLTLIALLWAARPLFDREGLVYLGVLMATQPAIHWYFAAGRPDHHSLIGLLIVVLLGLVVRLLADPRGTRTAVVAGVVAAVLIWVTTEGLVAVAGALATMGLAWIGARQGFARKNLVLTSTLFVALAVVLPIERPWDDIGAAEYDRISVAQLFVFACIALFWLVIQQLERHAALCASIPRRAALGLAGAVSVGGIAGLVVPKFFIGPMADVDPQVIALWLDYAAEMRPFIQPDHPTLTLLQTTFFLGPALFAVPYLGYLLWRGESAKRRAWMAVALGLALFLPLTLWHARRWAPYAELFIVLPYAALLVHLLGTIGAASGDGTTMAAVGRIVRSLARSVVVIAFASGFLLLPELIPQPPRYIGDSKAKCPLTPLIAHLDTVEAFAGEPRRILGFFDFGPEILYRTKHQVVASPYHRNTAGILDTFTFFRTVDDSVARDIVTKRGIDFVLTCPASNEPVRQLAERDDDSLYRRLEDGNVPDWLRPIALPADLGAAFRLYAVTR